MGARPIKIYYCGVIAQMGERLNGIQKVRSSILLSSTIKTKNGVYPRFLCFKDKVIGNRNADLGQRPEEQKQPQNVVFGRQAKVACEQASASDARRTNRNRVPEDEFFYRKINK